MKRLASFANLARCLAGAGAVASLGCISGVTGGEVLKGDEKGLRYFLAAPYLVVTETGNGQWDARFELGVDRSREFAIVPYNYFAINHAEVAFHPDGTLKSFTLTQDSDDVPVAVTEALRDVGLEGIRLRAEQAKAEQEQAKAAPPNALVAREAEAKKQDYVTRRSYLFRIDGGTVASRTGETSMIFVPSKTADQTRATDKVKIACKDEDGKTRKCTKDDPGELEIVMENGDKLKGNDLEKKQALFELDEGRLTIHPKDLAGILKVLLGKNVLWEPDS